MKTAGFLALLFAVTVPATSVAQDPVCKVTRTVVETSRTVLLLCDELTPSLPARAELHIATSPATGDPRVTLTKLADVRLEGVPDNSAQWRRMLLPVGAPALAAGTRYVLHIPPTGNPPSKAYWHEFSTEFEATITDAAASIDSGRLLTLTADVTLKPATSVTLDVTENGVARRVPAAFEVSRPDPVGAGADPDTIGRMTIRIAGARLPDGKVKLTVNGLTDLFGSPVETGAKARTEILGRKLSGLAKDEVGTYLKFGHQAARQAKPVWTIDSKVAVELPWRLSGWRVIPAASADIGFGPSKSSNAVNLGVGFTRFDLFISDFENPGESSDQIKTTVVGQDRQKARQRWMQGARTTVSPTFEADRDFLKRNVLIDFDNRLFPRGLYNPLARQNRLRLEAARRTTPDIQMDEIVGASFGWTVTTAIGLEAGGALDDQAETFDAGEGGTKVSTTVVAPSHGIFRLRPKVGLLLEFKRFSLNLQGSGRLLGTKEYGLVESNDIYTLQEFDNWYGYGELTISVPLSARTAIDSAWKVGHQPPLYQAVNTLQTGFAFRF